MKDYTSPDTVHGEMSKMYSLINDNKNTLHTRRRIIFEQFPIVCSYQLLSNRLVYIAWCCIAAVCQRNVLRFSRSLFVQRERGIVEVHHALDVQSIQLVYNLITTTNISNF